VQNTTLEERIQLADVALAVAKEAGSFVLGGFRTGTRVELKAVKDLVTQWDRDSEALIAERLRALCPDVAIVGEESFDATSPRPDVAFIVDPIDGTTNFVHGHPFWAVSIGVLDGGSPVAGALVAPSLGITWRAAVDPGGERSIAERNGAPCRVSGATLLRESLVATGFPPVRDHAPENNFDSFMSVKRRALAVRRCGSAAIDIAFVGDGTYDAYWERRLHVWDAAAGCAVVLAGGGRITSLEGGPADLWRGHIVASNGHVHDELVRAVAGET
jgi:myo-inositol-1(or 4)-monophosphatase